MRNSSEKRNTKVIFGVILGLLFSIIIGLSAYAGYLSDGFNKKKTDLENAYQSAYYSLMINVNNVENDLAKSKVIYSASLLEETLEKVVINCELATNNLALLTNNNYNTNHLIKFFNQIGDYSNYTLRKVEKTNTLPAKNMEVLAEMAGITKQIGVILGSLRESIEQGYMISDAMNGKGDLLGGIMDELSVDNIEYPVLIYDGPFSDGVKDREAKGIHGEELSKEQAVAMLPKYLNGYNIKQVNYSAENNNRIASYLFEVEIDNGRIATVQLAKKGGMLLMMDIDSVINEPKLTVDDCLVIAKQYCQKIGLDNMETVWVNNNNSTVYVNLCYKDNDIIMYPDMIKLKISLESGQIIGYEGLNYAFNHTSREKVDGGISENKVLSEAKVALDNIQIRRVVIPINVSEELHCYELVGELDGEKYFIYVDIISGNEVKVMRMIDSNQGELLM